MSKEIDKGPTDKNSFRYGVASGLWAAAAIARRHGNEVLALEIEQYEKDMTAVDFGVGNKIHPREMTYDDLGLYAPNELKPIDLGLDEFGHFLPKQALRPGFKP